MNFADTIIALFRLVVKAANPATLFFASLYGLGGLLLGVTGKLDFIIARLQQLELGLTGSADFSVLGLANYLFPLGQLLGFFTAYMGLLLTCTLIRIVKSWIPTVS
jgi:hypothetical protein